MATKQFYATGTFKYQHRMLTAGEPVQMDGPTSRLYIHLGKISPDKPRTVTSMTQSDADGSSNLLPATVSAPLAPRRRTAKKRATAKK